MTLVLPTLLLIGIQGSGKGTQAQKLVKEFGYQLFETGAQLRKISQENTPTGNTLRAIIERGDYVPAKYISKIIQLFIESNQGRPLLFDSPMRDREQDTLIKPLLGDFKVVHLDLNTDIAINRIIHRRVDSVTGEVFPEDFSGNTNPTTGNPLIIRSDDTPDSIKNRIRHSLEETLPLLPLWEKEGYTIYHINANQSPEKVFTDICTSLF